MTSEWIKLLAIATTAAVGLIVEHRQTAGSFAFTFKEFKKELMDELKGIETRQQEEREDRIAMENKLAGYGCPAVDRRSSKKC